MKTFFRDMNLARAIIILSLAGAVVLAGLCWARSQELGELEANRDGPVRSMAAALMQQAHRHTQLSKAIKDDSLAGQTDLESYIRRTAAKDKVDIGSVDMIPSTEQRTKGIVDRVLRIRSSDRGRSFPRLRIANFLYMLETESRRVRITEVKIEVADKRIKKHEVPEDLWTFEAELTSRQRAE